MCSAKAAVRRLPGSLKQDLTSSPTTTFCLLLFRCCSCGLTKKAAGRGSDQKPGAWDRTFILLIHLQQTGRFSFLHKSCLCGFNSLPTHTHSHQPPVMGCVEKLEKHWNVCKKCRDTADTVVLHSLLLRLPHSPLLFLLHLCYLSSWYKTIAGGLIDRYRQVVTGSRVLYVQRLCHDTRPPDICCLELVCYYVVASHHWNKKNFIFLKWFVEIGLWLGANKCGNQEMGRCLLNIRT